MPAPTVDDYRWLTSDLAAPYLTDATASPQSLVTLTKRLRRDLTAEQVHLVLEQVELRQRAREKFSHPDCMLFTRQLLEQSTDQQIARYKATRFPASELVADLCCGIGGDLLALLERGPCWAVDRDPVAILLAAVNGRSPASYPLTCEAADVREVVDRLECAAWHIDPDRRVAPQRTTQVEFSEPGWNVVTRLIERVPHGAVKLAPGADLSDTGATPDAWEREWIGSRRECRQQVVWTGDLANHPGQHTATMIDREQGIHTFTGEPNCEVDIGPPGQYLFDPDSAILAAQLAGAVAASHRLRATSFGPAYLTGDTDLHSRLLDAFRVESLLSLDLRRLKRLLRDRHVGTLEIKVKNVSVDPAELRRKLQPQGQEQATLLVFRSQGEVKVAVAQRCR